MTPTKAVTPADKAIMARRVYALLEQAVESAEWTRVPAKEAWSTEILALAKAYNELTR